MVVPEGIQGLADAGLEQVEMVSDTAAEYYTVGRVEGDHVDQAQAEIAPDTPDQMGRIRVPEPRGGEEFGCPIGLSFPVWVRAQPSPGAGDRRTRHKLLPTSGGATIAAGAGGVHDLVAQLGVEACRAAVYAPSGHQRAADAGADRHHHQPLAALAPAAPVFAERGRGGIVLAPHLDAEPRREGAAQIDPAPAGEGVRAVDPPGHDIDRSGDTDADRTEAIRALVRCMAIDYAPHGIRVNAVLPGVTETGMKWANVRPEDIPRMRGVLDAEIPLGRLARPEELARAAIWLLSDEAAYVTGSELACDGRVMAKAPISV